MKTTITRQQWIEAGTKAGWLKLAQASDTATQLSLKFPRIYRALSAMPGFNAALDIVSKIRQGSSPESMGITPAVLNQAKQLANKISTASSDSLTKEAFNLDGRLIAAIIIIILGIAIGKAVTNGVGDLKADMQNSQQQQMNQIHP